MRIEPGRTMGLNSNVKGSDTVLESIQKQINKLRDQLKEIDADEKLTLEQKNEQKELIHDQISNLRQQYSQREMALIREQQKQNNKVKVFTEDQKETDAVALDRNLAAMITADSTLSSLRTSRKVKTKLEAEENTIDGEIKLDAERGLGISEKVQQKNELTNKIQNVYDFLADDVKKTQNEFDRSKNEDKDNKDKRQEKHSGHVDVSV